MMCCDVCKCRVLLSDVRMMADPYKELGEEICAQCEKSIKSIEEGVLESWRSSLPRLRLQAVTEWVRIRKGDEQG
jgi:hypothetical protein